MVGASTKGGGRVVTGVGTVGTVSGVSAAVGSVEGSAIGSVVVRGGSPGACTAVGVGWWAVMATGAAERESEGGGRGGEGGGPEGAVGGGEVSTDR